MVFLTPGWQLLDEKDVDKNAIIVGVLRQEAYKSVTKCGHRLVLLHLDGVQVVENVERFARPA